MSLTFAFLIGLLTGLRSLTPAGAIAWAAYLGWLHLPRSLAWMGTLTAVVIFSALALFELINDKRPTTPARTAPPGLVARVVLVRVNANEYVSRWPPHSLGPPRKPSFGRTAIRGGNKPDPMPVSRIRPRNNARS
jgi:uncharacterized membrane protein